LTIDFGQFWAISRPHRRAEAAAEQLALQRAGEVLDFFLVDEQLGVAGDAELVGALDLQAGEQVVDEGGQHGRQEHEVVLAAGHFLGIWMMRGSERGARTIAMPPLRPKASLPSSTTTTFRLLLRMRGKGCAGSRPSGDSTGSTSLPEVLLQPARLLRVPALAGEHAHAGGVELPGAVLRSTAVLFLDQLAGLFVQALEHQLGRVAVGQQGRTEFLRGEHGGHAHFEELVEVGAGDAQVAQALEQRHRGIGGLREHAEVEFDLRKLAVEVELAVGLGEGKGIHVRQ
jgi:hypothetical protein